MDIVSFGGWGRNARIVSGHLELIVTLEVGPRVLFFGESGGDNELRVDAKTAGLTGGDQYRTYGGHRLWIAPEMRPRTFTPDNGPVDHEVTDGWHVFLPKTDEFGIQKEIRIRAIDGPGFELVHRLHNRGAYDVDLSAWTPTQCAPGGVAVIPQAVPIPQSDRLLPVRPVVLWGYTQMDDPRFRWGAQTLQTEWMDRGPTKFGTQVEQGIAAYLNRGRAFVKRFDFDGEASYPDMGCNFELFTRADVVEVESLSPLRRTPRGGYVEHREVWYLRPEPQPDFGDAAMAHWLAARQIDCPS